MPGFWQRLFENLLVAAVYISAARLGQSLAIPPGNVTPVWLPSGLMLAWALIRGRHIWIGVFLGAYIGNVSAYFDPTSFSAITHSLLAGIPNGVGDALAAVGSACLLVRYFQPFRLFRSVADASAFFLIGVIGGSAISAVFGVTGLLAAGFISSGDYGYVFATWFTGDAVGVLTITPLVIALVRRETFAGGSHFRHEALVNFLLINAAGYFAFWGGFDGLVLSFELVAFIVVLIWAALRLSGLYISIIIFYLAAGIVISTAFGVGPLESADINAALINAQLIVAVAGVVALMLHANREQVRLHVHSLELAKRTLNQKVLERTAELEKAKADAERMASIDALTGAPNRRVFFERGGEEFNRAMRSGEGMCLIMFDIDRFKLVNDIYGHQMGDVVLKDVADVTMNHIRNYDLFGRLGGEEFAIILPETNEAEGFEVAEKLRERFAGRSISDQKIRYTASFGVTAISRGDKSLSDTLHRADVALYKAKSQGRNQVIVFQQEMDLATE